ncbi:MAG: putative diguanylate cyclase [Acidimicrobiaceae bacterium]|nr:putative diguanylate cyclase [Acidimicrobiaceae bacterium]
MAANRSWALEDVNRFRSGRTKLQLVGVLWVAAAFATLVSLLPAQPPGTDRSRMVLLALGGLCFGLLIVAGSALLPIRGAETSFHCAMLLGIGAVCIGLDFSGTSVGIVLEGGILCLAALYTSWATLTGYMAVVAAGTVAAELIRAGPGAVAVAIAAVLCLIAVGGMTAWARHHFEQLAEVDPLCAVPNRAGLERRLRAEVARAERSGQPLAVAVADLDDFKLTNDRLGHAAGDALLRALAERWCTALRASDLLARLGGDEFVAVLPGADAEEAANLLRRLADTGGVPVSFGVAHRRSGEGVFELLHRADLALLRAKQTGRGQIVLD